MRLRSIGIFISGLLVSFALFSVRPAAAEMLEIVDDAELAEIQAMGFYFRMDISLEAFTNGSEGPNVTVNTGEPYTIEGGTEGSPGFPSNGSPLGSINMSGNAQSNLSSLINIVGATSVINVGLNIINIQNSTNDTIITTNINSGAQGTNITFRPDIGMSSNPNF